jgi:hypothetical protein
MVKTNNKRKYEAAVLSDSLEAGLNSLLSTSITQDNMSNISSNINSDRLTINITDTVYEGVVDPISNMNKIMMMFPITDNIVKTKDNKDMCMFYAMYNSLRSSLERYAFSMNDPISPHNRFGEMFMGSKYSDRITKDGYNYFDMRQYLSFLKSAGYIKGYTWIKKKNWRLSSILASNQKSNLALILFGISVKTDERLDKKKFIAPKNCRHPAMELCRKYDAFEEAYIAKKKAKDKKKKKKTEKKAKKKAKGKRSKSNEKGEDKDHEDKKEDGDKDDEEDDGFHGSSICRESDGRVFFYDIRARKRSIADAYRVHKDIVNIFDVVEFSIDVDESCIID